MRNFCLKTINTWLLVSLMYCYLPATGLAATAEELLRANCTGCHIASDNGNISRISYQRKTPEGWLMTIVRMQQVHHIPVLDPDNDNVVQVLVKYLADTQGLAPAESEDFRYILERRLNTIEQHEDEEFAVMCARCHTGARVALQRRNEQEWQHLIHFHLGQFPSTEYSAGGRDRDWFGVALNRTVPYLASRFPLESKAWQDWQLADKPDLAGNWRLTGNMPGKGAFHGYMEAAATDKDNFELVFQGEFSNGDTLEGTGQAIVYTGFEWRGSVSLGEQSYQQVLAADASGELMRGRMYLLEHEESGIDLQAVRAAGSGLLDAFPGYLNVGHRGLLTLVGLELDGEIALGEGVHINEIIRRDSDKIVLDVQATADARPGARTLSVGNTALPGGLTVYRHIDYISVTPDFAIARVGGNDGTLAPVNAVFEAMAYSNGADGLPNTADDMVIGKVPALWSVRAWDDAAAQQNDVTYAGTMDRESGVFTPGPAGPNPERKYGTNNVGNLAVVAELQHDGNILSAEAHLIVTVQRWNNPPIR